MSLEDLRAQAEAEDKAEAEKPEPELEVEEEVEPETEEDEEPEAAETDDDFELELEGEPEPDQQKHNPVEVLQHKLSRERKKKREARTEVDELRDQVKQLTQMMQGTQQPSQPAPQTRNSAEPKVPDMYDPGIDGDRDKYDYALKQFWRDWEAYNNRHNEADKAQQQNRERFESMTKELANRAAKFASENKVSVDRVADALDKATSDIDEATGIEGALAYLLDSVGDGSERVAYYIGTNEGARAQVKEMLKKDPNGFKAISHMTRLADKLKPKHSRKISKAPEPDQPLKGDGSSSGSVAKKLQSEWDKATKREDMIRIRRKAREAGVQLKT